MADPNWRVRAAGPADADALSLVASATFLDTYAGSLDGSDLVAHCAAKNRPETFAGWASDPGDAVLLGEIVPGHAPVGYAVMTSTIDLPVALEPGDIELRRIYSLSRMHRSGLGPALMQAAVDAALRLGRRRILLGVWGENYRAHRFYERQGFAVVGTRQFRVGAVVHDDLVYGRSLLP
ncbi:GNAT family N-acetyltransferase [Sphingomonas sp. CARO-RG-8B-R24-01]|uniref:GNAT family N-acetyltransferase n=1 Tax=Sphingomonas sp. CARO-RG-8B-R24-01 TaxID=2914831 RepID=UPI001F578F73|nr:GNAT family N-acetyltransferase [Sphingomonas sp. CARO-RG-8B-R24-01]